MRSSEIKTRPSTVYIRKGCVKRRNVRCGVVFVVVMLLLLLIRVDTLIALMIALAAALVLRFVQ